ncbi:hypothetical protein [Mycolicibacterium austroafricanum]|nr:hypothetical protein [Mycolicibacterium austroafricanum]
MPPRPESDDSLRRVMSLAAPIGLTWWCGQALLSILAGTTCYVTLMSVWG